MSSPEWLIPHLSNDTSKSRKCSDWLRLARKIWLPSGDSTCLRPIWPEIGSRSQSHKWRTLTEHNCSVTERKLLALPARMGGLGMTNPSESVESEYSASIRMSAPLVDKIMAQSHGTPDDAEVLRLIYAVRKEKDVDLKGKLEELKVSLPVRTQRAATWHAKRAPLIGLLQFHWKTWILTEASGNFVMHWGYAMTGPFPIAHLYAYAAAALPWTTPWYASEAA